MQELLRRRTCQVQPGDERVRAMRPQHRRQLTAVQVVHLRTTEQILRRWKR